jgi:hypothetical protein
MQKPERAERDGDYWKSSEMIRKSKAQEWLDVLHTEY